MSVLREWGRLPLGLPRGILGGLQLLGASVPVDQEGCETWPIFVSSDFSD